MKIFFAIAAVFLLRSVDAQTRADCNPGDVWAEGKIKFTCVDRGTKAIGCLPNGKLGDNELAPGGKFSSASFQFQCNSHEDGSVSYDVIACMLNGQVLAIGQQQGIPDKGIYRCVRNADGTVSRKYQAGCYFNGKLYPAGQSWITGDSQITCIAGNGGYQAQASGCVLKSGDLVAIGSYAEQDNGYFKCQANSNNKAQAELFKVGASEYKEWLAGTVGGDEEAAGGESGSGFTRRPTTRPPTTTQPEPTTTVAPTTTPLATTVAPTRAATRPPVTLPPVATGRPSGVAQCEDLHPICTTLCSRSCTSQTQTQTDNVPLDHGEPIGFAFNRKANNKHRHLFGLLFGGKSSKGKGKWGKDKVKPAEKLALGNRPSTARPGFQGLNPSNLQSGNGGSWSWSHSWSSGGNGASQLSSNTRFPFGNWGSNGGWSQSWNNAFTGRPSFGGKPGKHSKESDSSSSSSCEGHDHGNGNGHAHGHGQGQVQGQGHISHGNGFGFGHQQWGNWANAGSRPQQNGQCSILADSSYELVQALCPKSCGACGKSFDLVQAATKWASASCVSRNPEPIGFAFEEGALPVQPAPAPAAQPAPKPGKPKKSKQKSKSKNKSRKGKGKHGDRRS